MKNFLKLCLCMGVLFMATPAFSQVPDPTGIDYCACLDGVQGSADECPPCDTSGGNNGDNNGDNNTSGGPPTEEGGDTGGGEATGSFPLVIQWIQCFFDPDC